jgi:uncharacterized protein
MRFVVVTLGLHVVLIVSALALWMAHRRHVHAGRAQSWRWLLRWGLVWLLTAIAAAGGATLVYRTTTHFTWLRFLAQLSFGELPLLGLGLGATLWRAHGFRVATVPLLPTVVLLALYVRAYHVEPNQLELRRHTVELGPAERPPWRRLRIGHLSDLQTHAPGEHERRALRAVLAEHPDLIVFTGDYVQSRTATGPSQETAEESFRALLLSELVQPPLGVYAVPGDVESHWPTPIAGSGVTPMSDEVRMLPLPDGRRIALVGLSLATSRAHDPEQLRGLLDAASSADYRIVFGHRPDFAQPLAAMSMADLALAGHTHGGQVALPLFGPLFTSSPLPRLFAGDLHVYRGLPLHVSRGVGMERRTAPQLRLWCPPEVCLIDVGLH